ncbi:MAG: presenilin family intramembrane aspartyl protease [Candidatus Pacearchaeota archaeon]
MKHNLITTLILLGMFILTQIVGLIIIKNYLPHNEIIFNKTTNTFENITIKKEIPYGMNIPEEQKPEVSFTSFLTSFLIAVLLIILLIKIKKPIFLRMWFFIVVVIALGISFNSFLLKIKYSQYIAFFIALFLAYIKVFKRNIFIHNLTEIFIYPGIAVIFVYMFNLNMIIFLLLLISIYDIYAVWYSGFMQKMAKYQINHVKVFGGFFVPYIRKSDKEREMLKKLKLEKERKRKIKKIKIEIGILGGGDVIFPLIMSGVLLKSFGILSALIIVLFSTISLFFLFFMAKKGKFYPAMPFLTIGCLLGLLLVNILRYFSLI